MNQHRIIEVTRAERLRDVFKMAANPVAALRVLNVVRPHLDHTALGRELEVMGGLLLGESHYPVGLLRHDVLVILLPMGQGEAEQNGGGGTDHKMLSSIRVGRPQVGFVTEKMINPGNWKCPNQTRKQFL